jgi:hypothetical protein
LVLQLLECTTCLLAISAIAPVSALAEAAQPVPYQRDEFQERKVEACALAAVTAAYPVQGGRNWVIAEVIDEPYPVECRLLPKLSSSPVPKTALAGSKFEGWKITKGNDPEQVGLFNGVAHRLVTIILVGPLATRTTDGPCHEPRTEVVCEGGGGRTSEGVTALRKAESELARAEYQLAKADIAGTRLAVDAASKLLETADVGLQQMSAEVTVKTTDGGLQTRVAFEQRIGLALDRVIALMKAVIAAKKAR